MVAVVLLVLLAIGLTVHQVFNYDLRPVDRNDQQPVTVVIPPGATDKQVATLLKKQGLIRSAYVFDYYLQTHKSDGVKAGRFKLTRSLSTPQLVHRLQQTKYVYQKSKRSK